MPSTRYHLFVSVPSGVPRAFARLPCPSSADKRPTRPVGSGRGRSAAGGHKLAQATNDKRPLSPIRPPLGRSAVWSRFGIPISPALGSPGQPQRRVSRRCCLDRHVRAGVGEAEHKRAADAHAAAGDQDVAPGQSEAGGDAKQTPAFGVGLSQPRAVRGPTRPADGQNSRLKLSTLWGAVHQGVKIGLRLNPDAICPDH